MNKQNSILIALALVIIAGVLLFAEDNRTSEFKSELVFPELIRFLPDVNNVRIENNNGTVIEAVKTAAGDWYAANKKDYPIDVDNIVSLLNDLAKASLDEAKTQKPENFSKLGISALKNPDSKAQKVTLVHADKQWELLVGSVSTSGAGTYIRKPEETQSWLTRSRLDLPDNDSDWLREDILDITVSDISSIQRTDGDSWLISVSQEVGENEDQTDVIEEAATPNNEKWVLQEKPDDRELKYKGVLSGFVEDMVGLSFSALEEQLPDGSDTVASFLITLNDGKMITLTLSQVEQEYFASLQSDELVAYWENWHYKLTSYAGGQLLKNKEDFLQELEVIETDETAETDSSDVEK